MRTSGKLLEEADLIPLGWNKEECWTMEVFGVSFMSRQEDKEPDRCQNKPDEETDDKLFMKLNNKQSDSLVPANVWSLIEQMYR